jgi:hypothetical protein
MSLSFRKAIENERRRKQLERRTKRVDRRLVAGLSLRIKIPPDLNSTAFGQQRLQNAALCAATIASASDNLYLYQPIRVTLLLRLTRLRRPFCSEISESVRKVLKGRTQEREFYARQALIALENDACQ